LTLKKKKFKSNNKYESGFYLLSRIFSEHVRPYIKSLMLAVLCMIVVSIATAVNAWMMKPLLDDIFLAKNTKMLYILPAVLVVVALCKGMATFFQSIIMKTVGQRIITDIQLRLYSHLIYSDMNLLNEHPSGNLISRFTNDINAMRRTVTDVVTGSVTELFTIIGLVSVMFYQSPTLSVIALVVLPVAFYPLIKLGQRMRKIARSMQEEMADFTVRLDETFQNIRIIKSYCREEYEISRAGRIIDRMLQFYYKAAKVESASSPIMETFGALAVAVVVVYGGMQVISGTTTPGSFFSFIAALLLIYKPLKTISSLNTAVQEGLSASRRLFTMLDVEPEIIEDATRKEAHFKTYNISFSNVYFSYKNNKKILDGISLNIPQGKTIALVGSSGSGKSTIFNLLQQFYSHDFGDITIDGKNIRHISLKTLRSSMALVSQDVALFDDTIRENIRYGRLNATDEEILDAAMAAAAHDFIVNLPDGYDTNIGQHGHKLSGGQRQRLAIARAILKNAPILLLDEATSALDTISEKQVQMALEYLKRGRTTIVIAHRLSTIQNADIIYVVSEGGIKESGSHTELLAQGGEYAELYKKYKKA
jgi:subfamily B ATP-binding cassette protein MsbA